MKNIPVLIDLSGKKMVAKIILFSNDEFYLLINDDSFDKFVRDKNKRKVCD